MKEIANRKEILARITPVIENVAGKLGLILVELDFVKESGRWHLKIFIYSPDHSISHKDCEDLTRGLEDYLDQLIPVPYYLEVSSPGTERKLKSTSEYNIFRGKKVEIKLRQPIEEENIRIFTAELVDYNPDIGLKVKMLDTGKQVVIPESNISQIKLKADYKI